VSRYLERVCAAPSLMWAQSPRLDAASADHRKIDIGLLTGER
jgi:hypothetical protein